MSSRRLFLLATLVAATALTAACPQPPERVPGQFSGDGEVLATVNGQKVTRPMMDAVLRTLPEEVKVQLEAQGDNKMLMDGLLTSEVMYQEAIKQGLAKDPLIKEQLLLAERNALAEALFQKTLKERATDARVQQWYNDHLVQFAKQEVQLAHIVVTDQKLADEVVTKAKGGADFAALAAANSKDPSSAQKGGDIGWVEVKKLAEPIREPMSKAVKGDVLGPFALGPGYHIFKVADVRGQAPLESVKDEIKARLEQELREEYMKELREKAVIVEGGNTPAAAGSAAPKLQVPPAGGAPKLAPPSGAPAPAPAGEASGK